MKLSGLDINDVLVQNKQRVYSGFLNLFSFKLSHKLFKGGFSRSLTREAIIRPPSVGVILYDPIHDQVVLVEQFRIGPFLRKDDPWLLEVVAGYSEPGETTKEVAIREVKEETGYTVTYLIPVSNFYVSPGASNEKLHLFCALVDSTKAGDLYGVADEDEDIRVHVIPFHKAYNMVEDGRIDNAPAVIALQWIKLNHNDLYRDNKYNHGHTI